MTMTVETPLRRNSAVMRSTRGVMGSRSAATSSRMRESRMSRFVAEVSSSSSSVVAPASTASMMEAAWEVDPEALRVVKEAVSRPAGRWEMKGVRSTPVTARPSAARTLTASGTVATSSRPSPGTCGYTPRSMALSSVDLPW